MPLTGLDLKKTALIIKVVVFAYFIVTAQIQNKYNYHSTFPGEDPLSLRSGCLPRIKIAKPAQVVITFYEKFPMAYVLRELNDWLEAGISYPGTYPDTMSELQALHTYSTVVCLVKSADRLIKGRE
jgi:hypothetical protein